MTRHTAIAALLLCAAPASAPAQSAEQPNFILSIIGGLTTGRDHWTLSRQLVHAPTDRYDTLSLGRRLRPGLVASVLATFHRSPNLGYVAEVGYFGVGSEGSCAAIGPYTLDAEQKNEQACLAAQGTIFRTNVVGFMAGVSYRVAPRGFVSPYVRATGGLGMLGGSFIETGSVVSAPTTCGQFGGICPITLLYEARRTTLTYLGTLAVGATWRAGQGYQVRFELRDLIVGLPVATDSAGLGAPEPFPTARSASRTRHVLAFTAGLDVILERRHRRRY